MMDINTVNNNRLWIHYQDSKKPLPTIWVKEVRWLNGESQAIIVGRLQIDRFLLDLQDQKAKFEIITSRCGDPSVYENGETVFLMENLRDFEWWTEDLTSCSEDKISLLYCQFNCDWIEICAP